MKNVVLAVLFVLAMVCNSQAQTTVNFDSPACPGTLTGSYGGIKFGSPWGCEKAGIAGNSTVSLSWVQNVKTATFSFASPSVLNQFQLGSTGGGTLTLTTDAGETLTATNKANSFSTVTTGFSKPATKVTVGYNNSWTLELDNIQYTVGTVTPPPPPAAPTATISASPTSINGGQSSTLTWSTTNATSATLNGAAVALAGAQSVTPACTSTFTLIAVGANNQTATSSATVTVNCNPTPPPPPLAVTISVAPTTASVQVLGTQQFAATVSAGLATWSTTCGTVDQSGLFTAPGTAGSCTVTATAQADTTKTASAVVTVTSAPPPPPPPPPTTGFEGYGAGATGGSTLCHVTSLGGLPGCLKSGNHVVFDVAGTISGTFDMPSNIFLDGFSAPSPGITLTGGTGSAGVVNINGVNNIIIQGLKIRGTPADNTKGIMLYEGNGQNHDIVIDHCEIDNVTDEDVGSSAHNVTLSWNLLASPASSGGNLIKYNSYHWSVHHNLWVGFTGNDSRVPLVWAGNDSKSVDSWNGNTVADVVGNVISQFLYGITYVTDGADQDHSNIINNYLDGQDTDHARNGIDIMATSLESHYIAGNASVINPAGSPSTYGCGASNICGTYSVTNSNKISGGQVSTPFAMPTITTSCVYDVAGRLAEWQNVISTSGVVSHYADDSTSAALRHKVTAPSTTILSQAWNAQTGSCQ